MGVILPRERNSDPEGARLCHNEQQMGERFINRRYSFVPPRSHWPLPRARLIVRGPLANARVMSAEMATWIFRHLAFGRDWAFRVAPLMLLFSFFWAACMGLGVLLGSQVSSSSFYGFQSSSWESSGWQRTAEIQQQLAKMHEVQLQLIQLRLKAATVKAQQLPGWQVTGYQPASMGSLTSPGSALDASQGQVESSAAAGR